ncbi:MAG: mannitol dehydrogenase family protein [Candidatus Dormibacteria bacterium]
MTRLSRQGWPPAGPPRPVQIIHLGLGAFHRAHQAWYTEHAADPATWGIAAFTGRSPAAAAVLGAQDGLFTLVERGPDRDRMEVVTSISAAHDGADARAWTARLAAAELALVTLTVTEAGYHLDAGGHLDLGAPDVDADVALLREASDPSAAAARTMPGRLARGLAARRAAGGGPLAVVPCDNLMGNGAAARTSVLEMCEAADPALTAWVETSVAFVSTVVDRITPATSPTDLALVEEEIGRQDLAAVVTEPFSEWVLCGEFPAGRPGWEAAGARLVADETPFAERKLWLLNGGHSLLAYAGSVLGHATVAAAVGDPLCRAWLEEWWDAATPALRLPAAEVTAYRAALIARWSNPRISHALRLIARDGSFKLAQRVVPVIRRLREAGQPAPVAAGRVLGAWLTHLRGRGAELSDPRAAEIVPLAAGERRSAARAVLDVLDPGLGAEGALVSRVAEACRELEGIAG